MLNAFRYCWAFAAIAIFASIAFYVGGDNEVGNVLYVASHIPATLWLAFASATMEPRKRHSIELVATLVYCISAIALMAPEPWIGSDEFSAVSPIANFAWFASYALIVTRVGFKIHSGAEEEGSRFWSVAFVFLWLITALSVERKVKNVALKLNASNP